MKAPHGQTRGYDAGKKVLGRKRHIVVAFLDCVVAIVRRGFQLLPRRWVVERTFGWMVPWRRLVRDCEARLDVSQAFIHVVMGSLLLRRISPHGHAQTGAD